VAQTGSIPDRTPPGQQLERINQLLNRTISFFALFTLISINIAATQDQDKSTFQAEKHKQQKVSCAGCHIGEEQPKTAATDKGCLACHKSMEAVAEKTADYKPNPHKNHITESNDVECTVCHHGHKADAPACLACHMGLTFEKK
jgi:hypothetical protein